MVKDWCGGGRAITNMKNRLLTSAILFGFGIVSLIIDPNYAKVATLSTPNSSIMEFSFAAPAVILTLVGLGAVIAAVITLVVEPDNSP